MDKNNVIKNIMSTMNVEGFYVQENETELIEMYLDKKITEADGIEYIKNKYR